MCKISSYRGNDNSSHVFSYIHSLLSTIGEVYLYTWDYCFITDRKVLHNLRCSNRQ